MKKLSPKQQQIYDYIIDFAARHGYPPSVREIGEHVGLKSPSTVHFHLKGLEAAGLITKAEGKTRSITVCGAQHVPQDRLPEPEERRTRCPWWAVWPPERPFWRRSASRII